MLFSLPGGPNEVGLCEILSMRLGPPVSLLDELLHNLVIISRPHVELLNEIVGLLVDLLLDDGGLLERSLNDSRYLVVLLALSLRFNSLRRRLRS